MPESGSPSPDSTGHSRLRLVFVVSCLVAVTAGGVLVASVGSGGLAGSPIDSVLPGEEVSAEQANSDQPLGSGGDMPQGLGSLTPGGQTGAGGEIALDNGTFASTDTEIHFVAESSTPTYWRTAAYGTYTGTGWERTTEAEPYDPPLYEDGFDTVAYNVTLNQTATALPTPWRPSTVDGIDGDSLRVLADGSIEPTGPLPNGTTFTGVSRKPGNSPGLLRAANDTIPSELERFTELPEDTPPRLGTQTGNIVDSAGADGRYETAMAVQNWLRENKQYSLDAYRETDAVADTFVFEMSFGYCEYFATSMAAMLRTQDIPTRYVVGYSSGQRVDNDTYQVRGMNAHAWVEVYFADIGWVQFDPTPGGARLQRQEQALQGIGEEYNVTDPASPGEQFDLDEDNETNGTETDWSVSLNRTAVPGAAVEVTVRLDGQPTEGIQVQFDGDPVGVTDRAGIVTATVPETGSFEISLVPTPEYLWEGSDRSPGSLSAAGGGSSLPDALAGGSSLPDALAGGTVFTQEPPDSDNETGTPVYNETVDVTTEPDVELSGTLVPGNEVGVSVFTGEKPVADAAVLVDGEERTRTDEFGYTTVVLPASPGETTIAVERGPLASQRTLDLPGLTVDREVEWPLAVPLAPVTVEASYGEDPAVGVPVSVNGKRETTTGANGEATVRLPFAESADIATARYGVGDETSVEGILTRLLLVVGSVVVVGVSVAVVVRRGRASQGVSALRERLGGLAARLLVAGAGRGDTLLGRIGGWVSDTVRLVLVALGLAEPASDPEEDWPAEQDGPVAVDGETGTVTDERARVRAAWGRFLAHVSAEAATHTPGELAAHAIEHDDLPPEPVWTLRDAFRAVEYGSRPAEPDRIRAALESIEAAASARAERDTGHGGDD